MKKFILLTAAALGLLGLTTNKVQAAFASTNSMLVQFQITAVSLTTNSPIVTTNVGGVVTTVYKTATNTLTSKDFLKMLAIEFNTSFPTNAQLAFALTGTNDGFQVVDQNGDLILDVSSNPNNSSYVFALSNNVVSGASSSFAALGKVVEGATNTSRVITFIIADNGVFYKDSHGNDLHIVGVVTEKFNVQRTSLLNVYRTVSYSLSGSGGGTFLNPKTLETTSGVFIRAQMTTSGKNIRQ